MIFSLITFYSTLPGVIEGREGVAIYVSKRFKCNIMSDLVINEAAIECIFVKILSEHRDMYIGVCYRPPISNSTLFQTFLEEKVSLLCSASVNVIVCGDFNLDLLKIGEDSGSASFLNVMNTFFLIPTITKPTRITDSSCTLIDDIFISYLSNITSEILTAEISDHLPIFIIFRYFFINKVQLLEKITFRITNETSIDNLYQGLVSENHCEAIDVNDIDKSVELIHDKILHH